jgi:hypothetical protein
MRNLAVTEMRCQGFSSEIMPFAVPNHLSPAKGGTIAVENPHWLIHGEGQSCSLAAAGSVLPSVYVPQERRGVLE